MHETIRKLREDNNYSQNSIATFLGISRQMYIKYEQGVIDPPLKVVKDLANFYRVPYETIIDNKFATNPSSKTAVYSQEEKDLTVASPTPAYTVDSTYSSTLQTMISMLPKLLYSEQLQLLSKLCDMVRIHTEEKKEPSKKMQAYQKLLQLNEECHLNSNGWKFNREELHER